MRKTLWRWSGSVRVSCLCAALSLGGALAYAQTIDPRDNRNFQDDRSQDRRHAPGALPPNVNELLKRLDDVPEAAIPDRSERAQPPGLSQDEGRPPEEPKPRSMPSEPSSR